MQNLLNHVRVHLIRLAAVLVIYFRADTNLEVRHLSWVLALVRALQIGPFVLVSILTSYHL